MKINNTIRLIELFAGYGSQALALEYLGIPFEHHFVCEFDKYAVQSYNEIHDTNFPTIDVTTVTADDLNIVETDKYKYLLTYSFPCTDLSLAGRQNGMARGSGTRSSLLWEVERLLNECGDNLPQYLMMENVPQVIGKANIGYFQEWTTFLRTLGYRNYYQVMNAEDYGIPQHRERVIMISILESENNEFVFPKKTKLEITFENLMETEAVDPKYYLSSATMDRIRQWKSYQNPLDNIISPECESVPTLTARGAGEMHAGMQLVFDNHELVDFASSEQFWRDYKGKTVAPTLRAKSHLGVAEVDTESNVKNPLKGKTPYGWHFEQEVHETNGSIRTLKAGGGSGNIPKIIEKETTWTPSETDLITDSGDVKTYTYSDEIQKFEDGQVVDLSFPGGYGHGGSRVYDNAPTLTATSSRTLATKESTIKGEWSDYLVDNNLVEKGDIAQITFGEPRVIKNTGVMHTITTRPDCFGVCVEDKDIREFVSDYNKDAPHQQDMLQYAKDSCRTIPAGTHGSTPHHLKTIYHDSTGLLRIRKLTPRECFRLMGVKDSDYDKLTASDQQKYKQAGNSIVVNVLMGVFKNLFMIDCKPKTLF